MPALPDDQARPAALATFTRAWAPFALRGPSPTGPSRDFRVEGVRAIPQ